MDPASGGPCQGIRNIIPALKALGVTTHVVSLDDPQAAFLGKDDFKIIALGPRKTPYGYSSKLSFWLEENIGNYDYAIIHGLWLYNSYGTYKTWKRLKKYGKKTPKLYVMPHGMLDPYFQKAPERRWKALRNRIFWRLFEQKVVSGVDGVLFTCEQELVLARTTFSGYHPKAVFNVGYGIQPPPKACLQQQDAFYKACPEVQSKPYWLFLSRIHEKKGVDILIKAYTRLKEEGQELPALVIAGPGMNSAYGNYLKSLCRAVDGIYFPGMLQGDKKWGAFYHAESFVLPSHQENFGIAVVEALACNLPVLISDQVNIWREIAEGKAGIVFEDSVEDTYRGLRQFSLMTDEDKNEMAQYAYSAYSRYFTIEEAAKNMLVKLQLKPYQI